MSDGQDKSDDLIAELAKLMAQGASGNDGTKPVPRPGGDAAPVAPVLPPMRAPAPAPGSAAAGVPSTGVTTTSGTGLRVPGMPPQPAESAIALPAAGSADIAPANIPAQPFTLRVPGEQPAQPAPASVPLAAPTPAVSEPIVAGVAPPPVLPSPDPMSELVAATREPVLPAPGAASRAAQPATYGTPVPPMPVGDAPAVWQSPAEPLSPVPVAPVVQVAAAAPAAAGSMDTPPVIDFDFDFGFGREPEPVAGPAAGAAGRLPDTGAQAGVRAQAEAVSGDPIAALISANLDREPPRGPAPADRPFPLAAPPPPMRAEQGAADSETGRFSFVPRGPSAPDVPVSAPGLPASPDPLDEIRDLVGKALDDEPARAPESPPAVPPLTTGFAPRRASLREPDPSVPSAEAAILAASSASGSDAPKVDFESPAFTRPKARPERGTGLRPYVGLAVAGTMLVAAGFGLYWVLGLSRPGTAEVPVLSADATPTKEAAPAAPAGDQADQGSIVFNQADGQTAPAEAEQLVSRDQSDAAMADTTAEPAAGSETELANRKVRTVTVRPDGTIVSGDEAVAGNAELPVDRPNVPDLPGADVQPSDLLAATTGTEPAVTPPPAAAAADANPATLPEPSDPSLVVPGKVAPMPMPRLNRQMLAARTPVLQPAQVTAPAAGAQAAPAAAAPADGPIDLTGAAAPSPTTQAAQMEQLQPVQQPAPVQAAPVAAQTGSGPYVQLSSQGTAADADASRRALEKRLAGVLNGQALEVRQVDLGQKGIRFRVVLPTSTFQQATEVCATLKANGIDCVPNNG